MLKLDNFQLSEETPPASTQYRNMLHQLQAQWRES